MSNGVQSINPNSIFENTVKPIIKWTTILVNNEQHKNVTTYHYNQNQFEFGFEANSFRHQGELFYKYQLKGLDKEWLKSSFANNKIKYSALPFGNYTFMVKAVNEKGVESNMISYSFSISPPFWFTWWFYVLSGLTISVLVASFFVIRINIIKKKLILEKQMKASEITAIKAQMNPHFMFNALNSIQDLIVLKDIRNSNVYLGKFADLMRKILEVSSKDFIELAKEIEILNLYLDLEKLRFGEDLVTSINCKFTTFELQELQIPSMLIQPYVENAIKHGLLHKKGRKELEINFFQNESSLVCEIIDNGVGRVKSREINARREKTYPSFSTEANKKRIDLISESTSKSISLDIIDLFDTQKKSIGTKVVFEFEIN
jgi:hypothetical protein